ncbi:MAG: glycosyltransferase family 39 protein [Pseudomonadota bacterium]
MNLSSARHKDIVAALMVAAVALAARLVLLPYATTDGSNSAARVWIAWRWWDDPGLITEGVWGPLHFYLIGGVLALTGDPVTAPIILHVLFGVAAAVLFYIFVRLEFTGPNSALLAALAFALYPVLLRASIAVRAESPFVFFVLGCMVMLSLARTRPPTLALAAAAGLALTLASMLRYEGWLLTPLLALLLWPRLTPMIVFVAVASLHPVLWMIGNTIAHGDPLYPISFAHSWELGSMGRSDLSMGERLRAAFGFASATARGMTLLAALFVFAGGIIALLRHRRAAAWLIPPAGLLSLLLWSVYQGSLVPKSSYTVMTGSILFPFSALAFQAVGAERWRGAILGVAAMATVGLVAVGSCARCFDAVGLQALRGISPVPGFENQETADELAQIVADNLGEPPAGVVTDFYGYGGTNWVQLLARVHPDRIFLAPWGPHQPLDQDMLVAFAEAHPEGILLIRPGSRFAGQLGLDLDLGAADLGGRPVRLEEVASVAWPYNDGVPLAADDAGEERVVVFRYATPGD